MTQHNGTTLTEYLIDQKPSLAVVLRQKIGSQNTHYVHGLRGIQSQVANSAWTEAMSDGLGLDTVGTERFGLPFYTFSDSQIEKIYSDYIKQNYSVPSSCSPYIPIDKARGFTVLFGKAPVDSNIAGIILPILKSHQIQPCLRL